MSIFELLHQDGAARTGVIHTAHGAIRTPAFIAVATRASVKALDPRDLREIGIQAVIANSYHLHLQPGEELIAHLGGVHRFSGWDGPTMTDSGGFQIFSLGAGKEHGVGKVASIFPGCEETHLKPQGRSLVRLSEEGAYFKSIIDGSTCFFSPENVVALQRKLGSDIIFVLDECTSPLHDKVYTQQAMERTHRWAIRAREEFARLIDGDNFPNPDQFLYGIVQGGAYKDLRRQSAKFIGDLDFAGLAIGGSLGKSKEDMHNVLEWTVSFLPAMKPRHLLGIGEIEDIFAAVERGIDTFDCAAPTRIARNGAVFMRGSIRQRINLRNAKFKDDPRPIDEQCNCSTCKNYSRAYLRHLIRAGEISFYRLASLHNLYFLSQLMKEIREAIAANTFKSLKEMRLKERIEDKGKRNEERGKRIEERGEGS